MAGFMLSGNGIRVFCTWEFGVRMGTNIGRCWWGQDVEGGWGGGGGFMLSVQSEKCDGNVNLFM